MTNMMNNIKKNLGFAALALVLAGMATAGCSQQVRFVTARQWSNTAESTGGNRVLYATYWEGNCSKGGGASRSCSKGNSHVKRCVVQPDNSAICTAETQADKALETPGQ
jgi:hypothetical protein